MCLFELGGEVDAIGDCSAWVHGGGVAMGWEVRVEVAFGGVVGGGGERGSGAGNVGGERGLWDVGSEWWEDGAADEEERGAIPRRDLFFEGVEGKAVVGAGIEEVEAVEQSHWWDEEGELGEDGRREDFAVRWDRVLVGEGLWFLWDGCGEGFRVGAGGDGHGAPGVVDG